jgi:hypothetical protein
MMTRPLDGFSSAFIQCYWGILREDAMNVFHELHAQVKFERSLNVSFIALISKKARAVDIKYFALSVLQAAFTKLSLKFSLTCLKQCWKKSFLGLKMLLSRGVRF